MSVTYHTPLDAHAQKSFGLDTPASLALADQVRFGELDVLNHVNNAVYFQWFERVRVRYVKLAGLSRSFGDASGPRIVIRSGNIRYVQEMTLDEDYMVTCVCRTFRNTSFTMYQEIWSGGTLRATFECILVLLRHDATGRYPIPEAVRQYFIDADGAQPEN